MRKRDIQRYMASVKDSRKPHDYAKISQFGITCDICGTGPFDKVHMDWIADRQAGRVDDNV